MNKEDRKKILLVEDEAILALTQSKLLEKYGYKIITVNTGEKAVDHFRIINDIDLILMDINLGDGIDGTDAAVVEKTEQITSCGYAVKNSGITIY